MEYSNNENEKNFFLIYNDLKSFLVLSGIWHDEYKDVKAFVNILFLI